MWVSYHSGYRSQGTVQRVTHLVARETNRRLFTCNSMSCVIICGDVLLLLESRPGPPNNTGSHGHCSGVAKHRPSPGLGTETGPAGSLFRNCDVSVCRSIGRDTRTSISIKAVVSVEWSQFAWHLSMAFKVSDSALRRHRSTRLCIVSGIRLTRSSASDR
jgi:hypothetical protein